MKTWETVTERDITTLAEWAGVGQGISNAALRTTAQRLVKRARNRGNNGHFAALKQIAAMINERRGPWAPTESTEEASAQARLDLACDRARR